MGAWQISNRNSNGTFRTGLFLIASLVLALLVCPAAMAQTTIQLISEGQQPAPNGYSYGSNYAGGPNSYYDSNLGKTLYVYPYYMSVNGSTTLTPMLCDSYTHGLPSGSWQVNVSTYADLANTMFKTASLYQEAAWLFNQLGTNPSSSNAVAVNYAIWGVFDPSLTGTTAYKDSGALTEIGAYNSASNQSAFDNSIVIYTPVTTGSGSPQEFIGAAPTPAPVPEPGTLALMGSGLAGVVGFVRRKRQR